MGLVGKRGRTLAGAGLLLLALTLPFAVRIADPLEGSPLPSILLELRGLDAALTSDALQLRLGLIASYDALVERQRALEQRVGLFVARASELEEPARSRLLQTFAGFQELLAKRTRALEVFPRENATLNNSLRLLAMTRARASRAVGADVGLPGRLRDLHLATLEYCTGSDALAHEHLARTLDELGREPGAQDGVLAAMLGHARIVAEQKGRVDEAVHQLALASGESVLQETFEILQHTAHATRAKVERQRDLLTVACAFAALIACGLGARTVLRQNAALAHEVEERVRADREARQLETELRHAQKLESVGQLAAGIAHEINTPTQYVADNTAFLRDSFRQILRALDAYHVLLEKAPDPGARAELATLEATHDLAYLRAEIPRALEESADGLGRIGTIVRAMKSFSHPSTEIAPADLNAAIQSTTTVARNEWKYVADLELDLDPALPHVPCSVAGFNQVVLNMLVNGAHAITARNAALPEAERAKGTIRIQTRALGEHAEVRITDSGTGIPEHVLPRIFDPFFTTKEVGKGTGQGLAIAHNVIVAKHGGTIEVETEEGRGTTFVVRLPLRRAASAAA